MIVSKIAFLFNYWAI